MYTFQRLLTLILLFALVVLFSCNTQQTPYIFDNVLTEDTSTDNVLIEDALTEETPIEDALTIEDTFEGYLKEIDGSLWLYVVPKDTDILLIPHPFRDFEGGVIEGTKASINSLILDLYEFVYPGKRITVLIDEYQVVKTSVVPETSRTTLAELGYVFSESEGWTLPNNE